MYIKDDICYAGELQENIKVTEAKPLRGGMMLITFSTGEKRLFDTTMLIGEAFKPLAEEKLLAFRCLLWVTLEKRVSFR